MRLLHLSNLLKVFTWTQSLRNKMGEHNNLTESFKRVKLNILLGQCEQYQQNRLHGIFPKGVPTKQLDDVIALCERTIKYNKDKPHGD